MMVQKLRAILLSFNIKKRNCSAAILTNIAVEAFNALELQRTL
jgi:hypothetical protein